MQELGNVYVKDKVATGELAEFTKRGGARGSMHMQEIGEQADLRKFVALLEQGETGLLKMPKKLWNAYWNGTRTLSDFRENMLRYATYLSYLNQMRTNEKGVPKNWGASDRNEVMVNEDIRDRAFKLSNELLGAYDQVSETGRTLRDIAFPFWSWVEVNFRRYGKIFRNGLQDGEIGDVTRRTILGQVMKSPVYAWRVGKTAFKVNLFWMLVQAFNHFVMGDDEEDLPPDVRGRPHLTLGRDSEGRVVYFDRIGAFADILDWFGLDNGYHDIREILSGRRSVGEFAEKMAKAPVSKLINAMTPFAKISLEATTGRQLFPDAFNPRSIRDMGVYFAEQLGLTPEFVALTGRPSPGYLKSRLGSLFLYHRDPEESAYWWIMDRKRQFQEQELGVTWSGGNTSKRGEALSNVKRAIRYGDNAAMKKALQEYFRYDGTGEGLTRSLESMQPLSGLSDENKVRFIKWLSPEDRKYLMKANGYAQSLLGK